MVLLVESAGKSEEYPPVVFSNGPCLIALSFQPFLVVHPVPFPVLGLAVAGSLVEISTNARTS